MSIQATQTYSKAAITPPKHIAILDGLRGVAILMVMVFHFIQGHPLKGTDQITFGLNSCSHFWQLVSLLALAANVMRSLS
jgi:peptidoglycan/LPS O-acetylase OafA/YrhL